MKNLSLIFLLSLFVSCNGQHVTQQKQEETPAQSRDTAMESYLRQEHRFEFKEYQMYYNGQLVKADSLKNIYTIFGKPKYHDEIYDDKPLSIKSKSQVEIDSEDRALITFKGKKYPVNEENYHYFEEGGNIQVLYDKDGDTVKIADSFRIQLSRHENPLTYGPPSENTQKLMSIPPLKGYVLINGVLVGKKMKMQELRNRLGKIKNGTVVKMIGDPVIIYEPETGHSFTEYDPKIDPTDDYIKVDIVYKRERDTDESGPIYFINYYYSIKQ